MSHQKTCPRTGLFVCAKTEVELAERLAFAASFCRKTGRLR